MSLMAPSPRIRTALPLVMVLACNSTAPTAVPAQSQTGEPSTRARPDDAQSARDRSMCRGRELREDVRLQAARHFPEHREILDSLQEVTPIIDVVDPDLSMNDLDGDGESERFFELQALCDGTENCPFFVYLSNEDCPRFAGVLFGVHFTITRELSHGVRDIDALVRGCPGSRKGETHVRHTFDGTRYREASRVVSGCDDPPSTSGDHGFGHVGDESGVCTDDNMSVSSAGVEASCVVQRSLCPRMTAAGEPVTSAATPMRLGRCCASAGPADGSVWRVPWPRGGAVTSSGPRTTRPTAQPSSRTRTCSPWPPARSRTGWRSGALHAWPRATGPLSAGAVTLRGSTQVTRRWWICESKIEGT
jgi:hypothetical protein